MPIRPENRDRYPADWPAISLRIRTDRADGRCECAGECGTRGAKARACLLTLGRTARCEALHGAVSWRTGSVIVLTVAHLDDTPEHCDDENLRAMCQACHLAYDTLIHQANRAATRRAAQAALPGLFEAPA